MKNIVKRLSLFVFLSVVFSSLIACSNTPPTTVETNANNVSVANNNVKTATPEGLPKSDYPEVPASIMKANLEALDAANFKLEDKKGKIVLINLWGIWCGPCKAEMPELIALQDKYREQGFEIIGLNVGDEEGGKESAENMKTFAEKMKLNYQLAWADDQVYMDLLKVSKFQGVPQSFLIDRDGTLHGVFKGASQNEINKLKDTLNKVMTTN